MPLKLLLVLVLTTGAAWAEWAHIGETDNAVLDIKPASVRTDGNLVTASQLIDYKTGSSPTTRSGRTLTACPFRPPSSTAASKDSIDSCQFAATQSLWVQAPRC